MKGRGRGSGGRKGKGKGKKRAGPTADDESTGKRAKSETESVKSEPRGLQENDLGLVDLANSLVVVNDLDEGHTEETVVASAVEPMERPLEVASAVEEHGFMNEGNEWEVMEEPPSDFALGPGFGAKDDVDETMEPSAAEAMEESEAASTVDAAMTAHDNGKNNEEIDDEIRLSELLPQVPNHDSLESSSLSPSPSTPSPPTPPGPEVENSGPHGAQVEEPGPGEEVVAEEPGAAEEAASSTAGAGGGGGGGPRVYSTPALLLKCEPHCQFKIRLNYNEHRFIGESIRVNSDAFIGSHRQKTYSKKFGASRSWQEALCEVHQWLWEKWQIVEQDFPLADSCARQVPGEVPADVLEALGPIVLDMPAEKIYVKSK